MKNKIVVFFVIVALIAMIIIPLVGCTNGEDTKTTTTNPIVALQEDVDELNENFNTEVANIKSRLSTLETSSIPANITNRVATLEANVAALQVTVNALSAGDGVDLTALTEAVNDIADDILEVNSNIDVISGNIDELFTTVNELEGYDYEGLREKVEDLEEDIEGLTSYDDTDLQNSIDNIESDLLNILARINDITKDGGYLDLMQTQINKLENSLTNLSLNKAEITSFVASTDTNDKAQLKIKTNKAGSYAIIITLYGSGLNIYDETSTPANIFKWYDIDMPLDISIKSYGSGSMLKIIIEPKDTVTTVTTATTVTTVTTQNNWVAGKTVELLFAGSTTSKSNIQYATIETAMR